MECPVCNEEIDQMIIDTLINGEVFDCPHCEIEIVFDDNKLTEYFLDDTDEETEDELESDSD